MLPDGTAVTTTGLKNAELNDRSEPQTRNPQTPLKPTHPTPYSLFALIPYSLLTPNPLQPIRPNPLQPIRPNPCAYSP